MALFRYREYLLVEVPAAVAVPPRLPYPLCAPRATRTFHVLAGWFKAIAEFVQDIDFVRRSKDASRYYHPHIGPVRVSCSTINRIFRRREVRQSLENSGPVASVASRRPSRHRFKFRLGDIRILDIVTDPRLSPYASHDFHEELGSLLF